MATSCRWVRWVGRVDGELAVGEAAKPSPACMPLVQDAACEANPSPTHTPAPYPATCTKQHPLPTPNLVSPTSSSRFSTPPNRAPPTTAVMPHPQQQLSCRTTNSSCHAGPDAESGLHHLEKVGLGVPCRGCWMDSKQVEWRGREGGCKTGCWAVANEGASQGKEVIGQQVGAGVACRAG